MANARLGSEGRAKILDSPDGVHRPRCGEGAAPGTHSGGAVEEILRTLKYYNSPESRNLNIASKIEKTTASAGRGALRVC